MQIYDLSVKWCLAGRLRLKLGASFPSLKLNVAATDDFKPRWADHPNEGVRGFEPVEDDADTNNDTAPAAPADSTPPDSKPNNAPAAPPVSLPLETYTPPHPYRGGGRSY